MFDGEMRIICAGFGGQGVLTMGLILANTAMNLGAEVIWIPAYGAEMRGGTASCSVKISNERISSPFIRNADILIAMNEPSLDKYEAGVKPGGVIIVNSSMVGDRTYREDVDVYILAADELAESLGDVRSSGVAMVGALVSVTEIFDKETIARGVDDFFEMKGKFNPVNKKCLLAGYENIQKIK